LLPKQDIEFDLELTLEFVLEITDNGRPRVWGARSPITSSSLFVHALEPKSVSAGDSSVSLICCRPFVLKSAYLEETETGESTTRAGPGEFVLVFGFDKRLGRSLELWLFPISSRCGAVWSRTPSSNQREALRITRSSVVSLCKSRAGAFSRYSSIPI
jgi:hypothetical protein